jgi:hypothetical protein
VVLRELSIHSSSFKMRRRHLFKAYGWGHLEPECPRTLSLVGDIRHFTQKGAESSYFFAVLVAGWGRWVVAR